MSSKVEIVTVNTPLNSSSFQQQINHNFSVIEESLNKQLQREPQEDVNNEMEQELDMNSHRIINVAEPVNNSDAATKHYVDTTVKPELEANKVVVSDSNGDIVSSSITTTELNTLSGISGNIQEQIDSKQDTISDLAEIRAGAAAGATALQSTDLKTINGESVVGEGDIVTQNLIAGNNITISDNAISAPVMTGASSLVAGTSGVVPQPAIGDQVKFLRGDGTWVDLGTVMRYKGSVATYADLPSSGMEVGDVWNVLADGKNYAWTGTAWDDFGGAITVSIASCSDVSLTNPSTGQVLIYNSVTDKWENGSLRQTFRGVYDATVQYYTGDIVQSDLNSAHFYIARQDNIGQYINITTYWTVVSDEFIVNYREKSDNVEYRLGCVEANNATGNSYCGGMAFTRQSSPTINASTGALTAVVLKTTTQTQGDNSTKAATTAYVDTAVSNAAPTYNSSTQTLEF